MFANAENIQNKLVLKLWSIRRNIGHTKAKKSTTTNHKGKKMGPFEHRNRAAATTTKKQHINSRRRRVEFFFSKILLLIFRSISRRAERDMRNLLSICLPVSFYILYSRSFSYINCSALQCNVLPAINMRVLQYNH